MWAQSHNGLCIFYVHQVFIWHYVYKDKNFGHAKATYYLRKEKKHIIFKLSLATALYNLWMEFQRLAARRISCRAEARSGLAMQLYWLLTDEEDKWTYALINVSGSFTKHLCILDGSARMMSHAPRFSKSGTKTQKNETHFWMLL